jgi:membrane protein implicated in regulation of membrane protease activity
VYGALWRVLPGPTWLRAVLLLVLAAAVVYVLFTWVFPWLEPYLPFNDQTVETGTSG